MEEIPRAVRVGDPRGGRRVRPRRVLRRALPGPAPARRGAGAGRPARQRDRGRHPGLLAAAPPPEAGRGGARAVPHRRAARRRSTTAPRRSAGRPATTAPAPCEYLVGADGTISFLEVNTRLQVEHPVTEETAGIDLVREQFRIADGEKLRLHRGPDAARARDRVPDQRRGPGPRLPARPRHGHRAAAARPGPGVRVDAGVEAGDVIGGNFDSLLAKLIVTGETRERGAGARPPRAGRDGRRRAWPPRCRSTARSCATRRSPPSRSPCTPGGSRPSSTTPSRRSPPPPAAADDAGRARDRRGRGRRQAAGGHPPRRPRRGYGRRRARRAASRPAAAAAPRRGAGGQRRRAHLARCRARSSRSRSPTATRWPRATWSSCSRR